MIADCESDIERVERAVVLVKSAGVRKHGNRVEALGRQEVPVPSCQRSEIRDQREKGLIASLF